ncbi:MAG: hypothetical protein ACAH83_11520 [Alphaproteobacteria bacterium]
MNLKTIAGFRNTEEAQMFAAAIEFRAKGFEYESAAPEARQAQKPVAAH